MKSKIIILIITVISLLSAGAAEEIVDDFERGNLDPYTETGDDNDWHVQTDTVYQGTYALEFSDSVSGSQLYSEQGDGLDNYPERGDDTRLRFRYTEGNAGGDTYDTRMRFRYFYDTDGNYYSLRLDMRDNELIFKRSTESSGREELDVQSVDWTNYANEWIIVDVETDTDGQISNTIYDSNGNMIGSVGGIDETHDSGGIEFAITGTQADEDLWVDNYVITDSEQEIDVINPDPEDNEDDVEINPELSAELDHSSGGDADLTFYDASSNNAIGTVRDVEDGERANIQTDEHNIGSEQGETYQWYVEADDGEVEGESDTWSFTTISTASPELNQNERYPSDGTVVNDASTDLGIEASHPDGRDSTVSFYAEEAGEIDSIFVEGSELESGTMVETSWNDLPDGHEDEWYVEICDIDGDCERVENWDIEFSYAEQLGLRDDDYHPQGADVDQEDSDPSPVYEGYIDIIRDNSSQLEPGMETETFSMGDNFANPDRIHLYFDFIVNEEDTTDDVVPLWFDTISSESRANQYAITEDPAWSIGNTGHPYPPGNVMDLSGVETGAGVYTHPAYGEERDLNQHGYVDDTYPKAGRVFGNSFAAVASQDFFSGGTLVREGDGVWVDPDNFERFEEYYVGDWHEKITYQIDITGPDAGLGFQTNNYQGQTFGENEFTYHNSDERIVVGDIYWQRTSEPEDPEYYDEDDDISPYLNQDMCGDDQREYLVEELGAINNSDRYEGNYACVDTNQVCYHSGNDGQKIFDQGMYLDTEDWTEQEGRLKQDLEKCDIALHQENIEPYESAGANFDQIRTDRFPQWYDQDFSRQLEHGELCRENTLFRQDAQRWIDEEYVINHPLAVRGGINDDWNEYLDRKWDRANVDPIRSVPSSENNPDYSVFTGSSWVGQKLSPVPTGTSRDYQATLGFCLGDDGGEYLITQQSETRFVENNFEVIGAGSDSTQCVLDGPSVTDRSDVIDLTSEDVPNGVDEDEASNERILYNSGDMVSVHLDNTVEEIACFDGMWFDDWPVVLGRDELQVPFEQTREVQFRLINPTEEDINYNVEVETESNVQGGAGIGSFTSIVEEEGLSFETEVPARDSVSYNLEVHGGNIDIDDDIIRINGEDAAEEITGSESMEVDVVESPIEEGDQAPREVPGLQLPYAIAIVVLVVSIIMRKEL